MNINDPCVSLWKMAGKCPILGWGEKESFVNDLRRLWGEPSLFGTRGGFFQYIALRVVQKLCLFSWCTEVYKTFCEGCESKKCEIAVRTRDVHAHARCGSKHSRQHGRSEIVVWEIFFQWTSQVGSCFVSQTIIMRQWKENSHSIKMGWLFGSQ